MNRNKLLYIGLNGYAGSGKDTVAKMLSFILNFNWGDKEAAYYAYCESYPDETEIATFNPEKDRPINNCMSIAFADQLKKICSVIFGIDVKYFYYNKGTSWICINKDFKYTEIMPDENYILSAEDFYSGHDSYIHSYDRYYMSLREVLVYVGTYILQKQLSKNIFVNIVNKDIEKACQRNSNIQYVICTDVRFTHEFDFIHEKNGIMVNITRNNVVQLDNIAEHDLDDEENFDFTIENNSTYQDLFYQVWSLVKDNVIFENKWIQLATHDNTKNYVRLLYKEDDYDVLELITDYTSRIGHDNGYIMFVDPSGGPMIEVGGNIPQMYGVNQYNKVEKIKYDENTNKLLIYAK